MYAFLREQGKARNDVPADMTSLLQDKSLEEILMEKKFSAKALSYGFPRLDLDGVMWYTACFE